MKKAIVLLLLFAAGSCGQAHYPNPHVMIYTSMGDIEIELFPKQAPKTVAAFLSYIDSGYYTNSSFYRVVMNEGLNVASNTGLIQGGIYQTNDQLHPGVPGIPHEPTRQTGLSHTNGTVSLARTEPGTASTEFFICIGDQSQFDQGNGGSDTLGFAAFGRVFKGMPLVRKIQEQRRRDQSFEEKMGIKKIERLE